MCARYEFDVGCPELSQVLAELRRRRPESACRGGEIYPSASAPVLLEAAGELVPDLLCWGFPWPGRRPVINARAETLLERPMFRDAALHRRCVVPASAFYEWDGERQKFVFRRSDGRPLYLAAVWDRRDGIRCFCVVTVDADDDMRPVHDRMPLILDQAQAADWVLRGDELPRLLQTPPPRLLRDRADGQMLLW